MSTIADLAAAHEPAIRETLASRAELSVLLAHDEHQELLLVATPDGLLIHVLEAEDDADLDSGWMAWSDVGTPPSPGFFGWRRLGTDRYTDALLVLRARDTLVYSHCVTSDAAGVAALRAFVNAARAHGSRLGVVNRS